MLNIIKKTTDEIFNFFCNKNFLKIKDEIILEVFKKKV